MNNKIELLNQKETKPWQHPNGKKFSVEELKLVSKKWDQKTWNEYLESTAAPLLETLLRKGTDISEYEYVYADFALEALSFVKDERCYNLERQMKRLMAKHLSPLQQEILWLRHWDDRTLEEICEIKNSSMRTIRKSLFRSYQKLKTNIFFEDFKKSKIFRHMEDVAV